MKNWLRFEEIGDSGFLKTWALYTTDKAVFVEICTIAGSGSGRQRPGCVGYADKKYDFTGGSTEGTSRSIGSDDLKSISWLECFVSVGDKVALCCV